MRMPSKSADLKTKLAYQQKQNEKESWYKLVVKIICWKDGISTGSSINKNDKISHKEWDTYKKRTIKTHVTYGKEKVLSNLKEVKSLIEKHGGFSKD